MIKNDEKIQSSPLIKALIIQDFFVLCTLSTYICTEKTLKNNFGIISIFGASITFA